MLVDLAWLWDLRETGQLANWPLKLSGLSNPTLPAPAPQVRQITLHRDEFLFCRVILASWKFTAAIFRFHLT